VIFAMLVTPMPSEILILTSFCYDTLPIIIAHFLSCIFPSPPLLPHMNSVFVPNCLILVNYQRTFPLIRHCKSWIACDFIWISCNIPSAEMIPYYFRCIHSHLYISHMSFQRCCCARKSWVPSKSNLHYFPIFSSTQNLFTKIWKNLPPN